MTEIPLVRVHERNGNYVGEQLVGVMENDDAFLYFDIEVDIESISIKLPLALDIPTASLLKMLEHRKHNDITD